MTTSLLDAAATFYQQLQSDHGAGTQRDSRFIAARALRVTAALVRTKRARHAHPADAERLGRLSARAIERAYRNELLTVVNDWPFQVLPLPSPGGFYAMAGLFRRFCISRGYIDADPRDPMGEPPYAWLDDPDVMLCSVYARGVLRYHSSLPADASGALIMPQGFGALVRYNAPLIDDRGESRGLLVGFTPAPILPGHAPAPVEVASVA